MKRKQSKATKQQRGEPSICIDLWFSRRDLEIIDSSLRCSCSIAIEMLNDKSQKLTKRKRAGAIQLVELSRIICAKIGAALHGNSLILPHEQPAEEKN